MRREPRQRRGAERVDGLLDACGELLDEVGYPGLTTRSVAERAGASIGSLYQFFDSKDALVAAFGQRNLDRYIERLDQVLEQDPPSDWTDVLDRAFDEYVAQRRSVPGFQVVDFALIGAGDANDSVAERVGALMTRHAGLVVTDELRRAFRVAVEAADAVVRLAFRAHPEGDAALLAEGKHMMRGYLADRLAR